MLDGYNDARVVIGSKKTVVTTTRVHKLRRYTALCQPVREIWARLTAFAARQDDISHAEGVGSGRNSLILIVKSSKIELVHHNAYTRTKLHQCL